MNRFFIVFFTIFTLFGCAQEKRGTHRVEALLDSMMMKHKLVPVVNYVDNYLITHPAVNHQEEAALLSFKVAALTELENFEEAVLISDALLQDEGLSKDIRTRIYIKLAEGYEVLAEYEKSQMYLQKAKILLDANPHLRPKFYTNWLLRKGSLLRVRGDQKHYLTYIDEAIRYGKSVKDRYHVAMAFMVKGFSDFEDDLGKTLQSFSYMYSLARKTKNEEMVAVMQLNIAGAYSHHQKWQLAKKYTDSAAVLLSHSTNYSLKSWAYQTKAENFEREGILDSALFYTKAHEIAEDDYDYAQKQLKVKEYANQTAFQNEKEASLKKRRILYAVIFVILGILIFIAVILKITYSSRKKISVQNEQMKADAENLKALIQEKIFLVKELNHRVKNNLAVILSLIDLLGDTIADEEAKRKFADLHGRIETIAIAHKLYAYESNKNHANIKIRDYFGSILQSHQMSSAREFSYHFVSADIILNIEKAIPLGMVLNELLTNSIKHAVVESGHELEVTLFITADDGKLELIYEDNGCEFGSNSEGSQFGTFIMEGMLTQVKATFSRQNSRYKIILPYVG